MAKSSTSKAAKKAKSSPKPIIFQVKSSQNVEIDVTAGRKFLGHYSVKPGGLLTIKAFGKSDNGGDSSEISPSPQSSP